jgi:hypothetical protein
MIVPTVGRVVWFWPSHVSDPGFAHHDTREPVAAIVAHVWGDRMVNLAVFDSNGVPHSMTSVQLLQDDDPKPEHGYFCAWMPYQMGQAAKTEAAEAAARPPE